MTGEFTRSHDEPASPRGSEPATPETLFQARLAKDPTSPLITFYDDTTGERAELSAKSLANWVAKTHFLLLDSLGLGPGDRACVQLPVHWLAAPILLGCWFAGLEVVGTAGAGSASVVFADTDSLSALAPLSAPDVFAVSMLSMARPQAPPDGAEDYATSVRPMPDAWPTVRAQAGPGDPALAGLNRARLAERAARLAGELGLSAAGRLLWTQPWTEPADWTAALLAPLAVGGSVVLVRDADPTRVADRANAEQATTIR